jgi:hypothetical protein
VEDKELEAFFDDLYLDGWWIQCVTDYICVGLLEHLNNVILKLYILIELGCTLFYSLGFLTRCEFYLDRFLTRQPLHQLKL